MRTLSGVAGVETWLRYLADPLAEGQRLYQRHGPLVQIGPLVTKRERVAYHAVGAELAHEVLSNPEGFRAGGLLIKGAKGSALNSLRQSYFSANGAEHAHYRTQFKPFFKKSAVDAQLSQISQIADREISTWPHEEARDLVPALEQLTQKLAIRAFFGDRDTSTAAIAAKEVSALGRLGAMSWRNVSSLPFPGSTYRKMLAQANRTEAALGQWARTRSGCPVGQDILSAMVNGPDEAGRHGCPMSRLGYVWNMFGAAYDTTTSILSWTLFLLSQHPGVARDLRRAIRSSGWAPGEPAGPLLSIPYLDWVMRETLRLMPPAPVQRRKATQGQSLGGYAVAPGASVILSAWQTNRLPEIYPAPASFNPERWSNLKVSPYEWLTFSAGPRRCTGILFAEAFIKTSIAHIVMYHSVAAVPASTVNISVKLTLRPDPGMPLVLLPADREARPVRVRGNINRHIDLGAGSADDQRPVPVGGILTSDALARAR
jgi:cytochrome P450